MLSATSPSKLHPVWQNRNQLLLVPDGDPAGAGATVSAEVERLLFFKPACYLPCTLSWLMISSMARSSWG
jgi:hypothetical protein